MYFVTSAFFLNFTSNLNVYIYLIIIINYTNLYKQTVLNLLFNFYLWDILFFRKVLYTFILSIFISIFLVFPPIQAGQCLMLDFSFCLSLYISLYLSFSMLCLCLLLLNICLELCKNCSLDILLFLFFKSYRHPAYRHFFTFFLSYLKLDSFPFFSFVFSIHLFLVFGSCFHRYRHILYIV